MKRQALREEKKSASYSRVSFSTLVLFNGVRGKVYHNEAKQMRIK